MRLHLLGSAAGKPVPMPFCRCRHIFGDGDPPDRPQYRVDMSQDAPHQMLRDRCDLSHLEHLLFTHVHRDHCDPSNIAHRRSILSDLGDIPMLSLYGSDEVLGSLKQALPDFDAVRVQFRLVEPFQVFDAGEMRVVPLVSAHIEGSYNYVVMLEDRTVLLAWDTGPWPQETWDVASKMRFDAVFMECTSLGPAPNMGVSHLSFATMIGMRERLVREVCITGATPFVLTHIGDNGGLTYSEQCELAEPLGITVGYDGLLLDA